MDSERYVRFKECWSPAQQHHLPGSVMMRDNFVVAKFRGWGLFSKTVDPLGNFFQQWNKGVLILCVFALAMDPLFFYIPQVDLGLKCVDIDEKMRLAACILRSIVDAFYLFHIALKFRTAFFPDAPPKSDGSAGSHDDSTLVTSSLAIARRYLCSYFLVDILAILPIPQIMLWRNSTLDQSRSYFTNQPLKFIIFAQSIPRIIRIYPIYKQFKSTSGFLAQTAWAAAAFNLLLYMLASHAAGAFWYMISVERQESCWRVACFSVLHIYNITDSSSETWDCEAKNMGCVKGLEPLVGEINDVVNYFCPLTNEGGSAPDLSWLTESPPGHFGITLPNPFKFGIFIDALDSGIVESNRFRKKLFYCFWWGLRNLSSLGQDLKTSTFTGEIVFAIGISVFGLVLFALLIGNMQTYLQSISGREEKMRVRRGDAEQWMLNRRLPVDIKNKVRDYEQSKWQLTKGVEEEDLIKNLPTGLRREIHRHLWQNTFVKPLTKFPMFKEMGQHLNDEMFDLLKPVVFPKNTKIIEVDAPVNEVLFITKGRMKTVNGIRGGGSYFRPDLKVGDLFGEELVTWACDRNRTSNELPKSNRKVVTKTQVEAYALTAEQFKSIASKFLSSLDSNRVEQAVKFLSMDWRTRAASAIQKAWQRHKDRKLEKDLHQAEQAHDH